MDQSSLKVRSSSGNKTAHVGPMHDAGRQRCSVSGTESPTMAKGGALDAVHARCRNESMADPGSHWFHCHRCLQVLTNSHKSAARSLQLLAAASGYKWVQVVTSGYNTSTHKFSECLLVFKQLSVC